MSVHRIERLADLSLPDDAVVIADEALPEALLAAFDAPILVAAGEGLKTLESVGRLAERVLARRSSKPMTIVAVGGGSVGDAVGFLASILWRGVGLWHVPTTLLAMVDSAHGGKTAVNLAKMKNQLGTFYPAERTWLVDEVLATLPLRQREEGLVELIKGLWLGDAAALDRIDADGGAQALASAPFDEVGERLMALLERAVAVKERIVAEDPYETKGIRTVLNLGHTAAHALELGCGLSHGQAVGFGLLAAARVSVEQGELDDAEADRLRGHVYPMLRFSRAVVDYDEREAFIAAVGRDKKKVGGRLRSVLLEAAGQPVVTEAVSAQDWYAALRAEVAAWRGRAVRVGLARDRGATLRLEASKSELNRALAIAALRRMAGHPTRVDGESHADDVVHMRRCTAAMAEAAPDAPLRVYAGEGGTTLRFLLAVACARPGTTRLVAHPRLLGRPHGPLVDALRAGGASIESFNEDGEAGFAVRGWQQWPRVLTVSVAQSSQFASALALLAAGGEDLELRFDGGLDQMVSRPYFDMTLELLGEAGVGVAVDVEAARFARTDAYEAPQTLVCEADASSAAVWEAVHYLGREVRVANRPERDWQPDRAVVGCVEQLAEAGHDPQAELVFDLGQSPDLAPVLAAAAALSESEVRLVGAEHLRHKESNRIDDLAAAFAAVGVQIEPLADGVRIPAGVQTPTDGARFDTHGDHRLAMAALVLTARGGRLAVEDPWVVAKSYPDFWHDARQAGWSVRPLWLSGSAGRSAGT